MQDESTKDEYAALIKPGDAVQTPDGQVWVVEAVADELLLVAASQHEDGLVYVDPYEQIRTSVPKAFVSKVADARMVRRP